MDILDDATLKVIRNIVMPRLPDESYKAFIFGSRTKGTSRPYSDIDVGIMGPKKVPSVNFIDIVQALDDSDIPYRTDVVDFINVSDIFKQNAMRNVISL